jgi:biotin-(acetyl-CoA carboxylase) ligase
MEMKKGKINELVLVFSKYLMFMNQNIKIMCSNSIVKKGIFRGINNDGSLKLEKFQKIENIYNGSIDL